MNLSEQKLKDRLVINKTVDYGQQFVFRFDNSYGLSVLEKGTGEGPKYNIAIVKFDIADDDYVIDRSTGITNIDVQSDKDEVFLHLFNLVENFQEQSVTLNIN